DVGLTAGEELQAVHLRSAHLDRYVQPGFLIQAGRFRLVEAAMLRLGEPTGQEGDLGGGLCRTRQNGGRTQRGAPSQHRTARGLLHQFAPEPWLLISEWLAGTVPPVAWRAPCVFCLGN